MRYTRVEQSCAQTIALDRWRWQSRQGVIQKEVSTVRSRVPDLGISRLLHSKLGVRGLLM